ncbi:hypothetical protein SUGI_0524020 [Cryptomeria japonica]|nr:hypothetical protein SUGI_0524020 [Cryptomeria japonica]
MPHLVVAIKRRLLQLQHLRQRKKHCRIADESTLPPTADHGGLHNPTHRVSRNTMLLGFTRPNCLFSHHSDEAEEYNHAPTSIWLAGERIAVAEQNYLMVQNSMRYAVFL